MLTQQELGARIAQARQSLGMSQEELGKVIGVDRSAMSRVEAGQRKVDSIELLAIADALGKPVDFFLASIKSPEEIFFRAPTETMDAEVRKALDRIERFIDEYRFLKELV